MKEPNVTQPNTHGTSERLSSFVRSAVDKLCAEIESSMEVPARTGSPWPIVFPMDTGTNDHWALFFSPSRVIYGPVGDMGPHYQFNPREAMVVKF